MTARSLTKNVKKFAHLSKRLLGSSSVPIPVADFKESLGQLNPHVLTSMRWNIDTEKSTGSTLVGSDNEEYLDLFMQISSIPLGYNNEDLLEALRDEKALKLMVSRPSMGMFPPTSLPDLLKKPLEIAPKGMSKIQQAMCGSCSVEIALKVAFMNHAYLARNGEPPSEFDLKSCMSAKSPGTSKGSILSFTGGLHGRTPGCLSMTTSKANMKVDMPAFDWPKAPFPELKYPLEEHVKENMLEEEKCLEITEEIYKKSFNSEHPIVGTIIEPIQAEGGDKHASDEYFKNLSKLARKYNSIFIIDEVQTGFGTTGKWWGSDYWNDGQEDGASGDVLCYAKKAQACGFYYNEKFSRNPNGLIFNTWLGEPQKLILMNKIIEVVRRDSLLENVNKVGETLHNGFLELEKLSSGNIHSSRGKGFFRAFDLVDTKSRDKFISDCFGKNLLVGPCGTHGVRFRPSLNFSEGEAHEALDIMRNVVRET